MLALICIQTNFMALKLNVSVYHACLLQTSVSTSMDDAGVGDELSINAPRISGSWQSTGGEMNVSMLLFTLHSRLSKVNCATGAEVCDHMQSLIRGKTTGDVWHISSFSFHSLASSHNPTVRRLSGVNGGVGNIPEPLKFKLHISLPNRLGLP